jgi:hypothetical protein
MLPFFGIAIAILLTGAITYLTSARFGVQASGFGKLPPHYAHLQRYLTRVANQKDHAEPDDFYDENEYAEQY